MDTISLYKHRIDALMDILFGAGVSNPQTIIEQLNYLLFLRALSIKDDEAELLGITDESEKIFTGDLAKYRWQNLLALNAEDLFRTLETSFDILQKKSKNPTVKLLFRNAHIKIFDKPTLRRVLHEIETFAKELDAIAHEGNKDVFGDMYEYLLSKLSSAGTNGQFRTPRHIIDFMVKVVDPKKNETILDPACGTAGFLVAAYRYIAGEYTSDKLKKAGSPRAMDKLSADEKQFLFNHMFTGFDSDEDMIKFGMMNLHLHGLTRSRLARQNSLTDTSGMKDKFDVILANPPFSGKIDEESVSEDIRMGTKATELLFLRFMMDHLSLKGKLAVIVPEGVVFNTSNAHTKIREMLLEKGLWAVVSLPSGVFNPYAGVKTSLLFLDAEIAKSKKELLFIGIKNDGFDLGAQRRPIELNDLPAALDVLNTWKLGKKSKSELAVYAQKEKINESSDNNLSIDRYRAVVEYGNSDWPRVSLEELFLEIKNGKNVSQIDEVGKYRVSRIQTIATGVVDLERTKFTNDEVNENDFLKEGDILFSHINSIEHLAKTAIFEKTREKVVHGPNLIRLRADAGKILPKYALFIFKSKQFIETALRFAQKAVNQASINSTAIKSFKIPLPPIEIQKQIAVELEGYQKVIDGARQIAENWKPKVEIDSSWEKVKLGDVADLVGGYAFKSTELKSEKKSENDKAVVKIGNLQKTGVLDITDAEYFTYASSLSKFLIQEGDVLVAMTGATVGKVGVSQYGDLLLNQRVGLVRPHESKLTNNFLKQLLLSDAFYQYCQTTAGGGAQGNISPDQIKAYIIPLPSIEAQKQIASEIKQESLAIENTSTLIPIFEQKIKDRITKLWSA